MAIWLKSPIAMVNPPVTPITVAFLSKKARLFPVARVFLSWEVPVEAQGPTFTLKSVVPVVQPSIL